MNKALLGKQAWRLITNPESLMANILPKYCKKEQFIKVKPQPGNSWIWKSLLIRRDVTLKGIDVQVWSGLQISISEGGLEKLNTGRVNELNNQRFMCPISHNWNIIPGTLNNEEKSWLQQRTFFYFWR